MLARCVICKEPFEQVKNERRCNIHFGKKDPNTKYERDSSYNRRHYRENIADYFIRKIKDHTDNPITLVRTGRWL